MSTLPEGLDLVDLLSQAKDEIVELRQANDILRAKADVLEIVATALGMRTGSQSMKIDIAWKLQETIRKLSSKA